MKRKRGKKFHWQEPKQLQVKEVKSRSMFKDRRLGEKNPNMDEEQKALLKFQRERAYLSRKKQKFELDDSFQLTHRGKALEDLDDDYVDEDLGSSEDEGPRLEACGVDAAVVLGGQLEFGQIAHGANVARRTGGVVPPVTSVAPSSIPF